MGTIGTNDGATIFYRDWGPKEAQPVVFHHGWPLSADDWDNQMLFFLNRGFRVIAHDRRGYGRSDGPDSDHGFDLCAADVSQMIRTLDLHNAVHIGHSAGGGEVARYVARAEKGRVAKAVLISAVTPIMLRSDKNPEGLPCDVFDGFRNSLVDNRAQFYRAVASGPFYGFNRPGVTANEAFVENWWRQGMMGDAKAQYDGIRAFSETDFTDDLRSIDVPVLVMHGEDDQLVAPASSARKTIKLLKHGTLKIYSGYPHGMCQTHAPQVNADLLTFIQTGAVT
jgi:non-heme chloroperoxidase